MTNINAVFMSVNLYSSTLDNLVIKTDEVVDKLVDVCLYTSIAVDDMKEASESVETAVDKMLKASFKADEVAEKLGEIGLSTDKMIDKMLEAGNATNKVTEKMIEAGTSTQKMTDQLLDASKISGEAADKLSGVGDEIDELNNKLDSSKESSEKASSGIGELVGSIFSLDNIQKGMSLIDNFTGVNTKLGLVNDSFETQSELQDRIFAAANRSRGAYEEMAGTFTKLESSTGDLFKDNNETITFTELVQKSFVAGGGSQEERSASMSQFTDSVTSGGLQSEDLTALSQSAPGILEAISNYTNKSGDELMALAAEGGLTADVIKNAMFAASSDINSSFENAPMTFADIWSRIKNGGLQAFSGIMEKITEIISSDGFTNFLNGMLTGFDEISNVAGKVMDIISTIANFFSDNWSWIAPLIWGIVTAFAAYNAVALITNGILVVQSALEGISTMAKSAQAGATFLETVAQQGLNAALFACPITWIIVGIIALIAIIYAVIGAINKIAGTSISATGVIMAAFAVIGAFIANLFFGLLELILGLINALINPFIEIANFIGNIFTNPISSIIYMFQGMADNILAVLEKVASAIDFVTGSNMAGTIAGWREGIKDLADKAVKEYAPDENYEEVIKTLNLNAGDLGIERLNYGDTGKGAYGTGKNLDNDFNKWKDSFNKEKDTAYDPTVIPYDPTKNDLSNYDPTQKDLTQYEPTDYIDKSNPMPVEGTGANGSVDVSMPDDDLKYMKEIAERDYVANIASHSLAPNISIKFGDVRETADANKVAGRIKKILQEEIAIASEGVY